MKIYSISKVSVVIRGLPIQRESQDLLLVPQSLERCMVCWRVPRVALSAHYWDKDLESITMQMSTAQSQGTNMAGIRSALMRGSSQSLLSIYYEGEKSGRGIISEGVGEGTSGPII